MKKTRTRFAPSPTGFLHIGSLRTVLFDYLIAKKSGGDFILRIEDTDQKRQVEGSIENLIAILDWIGIKFDEGPGVGGEYGPYIQTERLEIYNKRLKELLDKGEAYYCFCSEDRLKGLRDYQIKNKQATRYDNHCRNLKPQEVEENLKKGEKYVIRQKMPLEGKVKCYDELRGEIEFDNKDLDDQVLIKSDGIPTYQFANVVDDHAMEITHVIRGAEWIPSLPKNILLYKAFDWMAPKYVHIPLTLSKDGGKLSKRQGDVAVEDYRKKGYLPETLLNFSALLGWHPKDEKEIFTLDELVKEFSINRMGVSSAIFDIQKLRWINSEHIRRKSLEEFHKLAVPYYKDIKEEIDLMEVSKILHSRVEVLGEIPEMIDFLSKLSDYDTKLYINEKMKIDEKLSKDILKKVIIVFELIGDWNEEVIKEELIKLIKSLELKNGQVLWPVRIALSGKQFTPGGAFEIANILGKNESIERLRRSMLKLC
jgi:glutamyl-tRNA synthetase